MQLETISHTSKPAKNPIGVVQSRALNADTPTQHWARLSMRSGASVESLKVFAAAYQNTALSGLSAHATFAKLAKTN